MDAYQFLVDLHQEVVNKSYPVNPITWKRKVLAEFNNFYDVQNSKSDMQLILYNFQLDLDRFRLTVSRDGGGHITQMFTGMVEDLLASKWRFVDCMGPNRFKLEGPTFEIIDGTYLEVFEVLEWTGLSVDGLTYNNCSGELKTRSGIDPKSIDCKLPEYIDTIL